MSSAVVIFLKIAHSGVLLVNCILYLFQYNLLNIMIGLSVYLRQAEPLVPGKLGVSPGNNQHRRKRDNRYQDYIQKYPHKNQTDYHRAETRYLEMGIQSCGSSLLRVHP
jgi:hypothetical protein